jgi:hypothetical protein
MKVRIVVEYGEVLPSGLRDEYRAVPKVEEFIFELTGLDDHLIERFARNRVFKEIMSRGEVCEFIKMLDLELC